MSESSSFSSLLALVDSHLSKVNVQTSHSADVNTEQESQLNNPILSTQSDTGFLYGGNKRLSIPSFSLSGNPIKSVLAEQVANMLKAKQKKDLQKLNDEIKAMDISDDHDADNVIDLMEALRTPFIPPVKRDKEDGSSHSSMESLFEPHFIDCDNNTEVKTTSQPAPLLPCQTDLSVMCKHRQSHAVLSSFAKVLVAKVRSRSLPYNKTTTASPIKRFDFQTKSPCDILKEKLVRKIS